MSTPPTLELRAEAPDRGHGRVAVAGMLAALGAVLLALVVTDTVTPSGPVDRTSLDAIGLLGGALALGGTLGVLRPLLWRWSKPVVRLDDTGVHVRAAKDVAFVPWERVARLHLVPTPVVSRRLPRDPRVAVVLHWVPVDDTDVLPPVEDDEDDEEDEEDEEDDGYDALFDDPPDNCAFPFPLGPARARLATILDGTDRRDELREIVDHVREWHPHVVVLDAVLDSTVQPDPPRGDVVLVLASAYGQWAMLPHLTAALGSAGLRARVALEHGTGVPSPAAAFITAAGAEPAPGGFPDPDPAQLADLLDGAVGVVMLRGEPFPELEPPVTQAVGRLLDATAGRPIVLWTDDATWAARDARVWGERVTVVLSGALTEAPARRRAALGRTEDDASAGPVSAVDLADTLVALLAHPVGGVVLLGSGEEPIAEAVAGFAG